MAAQQSGRTVVASNRRARHDYSIVDVVEAGLVLVGSEVKSLREGKAQLADAYARFEGGQAFLYGLHIPAYARAVGFGAHDPDRPRKLLLHKAEIQRLAARVAQERLTVVPLSLYFLDGRVKVELALARGRKTVDKRHLLAQRDAEEDMRRALGRAAKGMDPAG